MIITVVAIEPDHFEVSVLRTVSKIEVTFRNNVQSESSTITKSEEIAFPIARIFNKVRRL